MHAWLVTMYEPIPVLDSGHRPLRFGSLAKGLLDAGHTVTLWTSTFNHARKQQRCNKSEVVEASPGYRIRLIETPPYQHNVSFARIRHNRCLARGFAAEARLCGERPQVILACLPTPELAEQAVIYGQETGIPVVVDIVDKWPDVYLQAFPWWLRGPARLALFFEYRRLRRLLRAATGISAVSESYLNWALHHRGQQINATPAELAAQVFPLAYLREPSQQIAEDQAAQEAFRTRHGIRPDSFLATFVGQFGVSYDLETIVAAARKLHQQADHRIQFVLAGDGGKRVALQRLAAQLPNVTFPGWLGHQEIMTLLNHSSVALAAYIAQAPQSLPYKPFEYMAAGLPILSSLPGELESLLTEQQVGRMYRAGDPESLVEGVRWFLAHPRERVEMGERARQLFTNKYDGEVVYRDYANYLRQIAEIGSPVVSV